MSFGGKGGEDPTNEVVPVVQAISALTRLEDRVLPAWLRPTIGENRIPVALAILAAAGHSVRSCSTSN